MNRLFLGVAILGSVVWAWTARPDDTPKQDTGAIVTPPTVRVVPLTIPTTTGAPTTTQAPTTTIAALVGPDTPCQEWVPEAIAAGWPADRQTLETLMSVIWRESRCQPDAWNGHDAGLTQINQIHAAWIEDLGLGEHPQAMFNPLLNLEFAWKLYSSREQAGKCGWTPWSLKC